MSKARDELQEKIGAIKLPIPKGMQALPRVLTVGEFLDKSVLDQILSQVDTYVKKCETASRIDEAEWWSNKTISLLKTALDNDSMFDHYNKEMGDRLRGLQVKKGKS